MDHSNIINHRKSFNAHRALASFLRIAFPLINSQARSSDLIYFQTAFLSDLGNQDIHLEGKKSLDVIVKDKGR